VSSNRAMLRDFDVLTRSVVIFLTERPVFKPLVLRLLCADMKNRVSVWV
jgi:hypothetical protein